MHPGPYAYGKGRNRTIVPLKPIGPSSDTTYPSALDILHINILYCEGNTYIQLNKYIIYAFAMNCITVEVIKSVIAKTQWLTVADALSIKKPQRRHRQKQIKMIGPCYSPLDVTMVAINVLLLLFCPTSIKVYSCATFSSSGTQHTCIEHKTTVCLMKTSWGWNLALLFFLLLR